MRGIVSLTANPNESGQFAKMARALALAGGNKLEAAALAEQMKASPRVVAVLKSGIGAHWSGDSDVAGLHEAQRLGTAFQALLRNASLFFKALDAGMVKVPLLVPIGWTSATATAFVAGEGAAVPVTRTKIEGEGIER